MSKWIKKGDKVLICAGNEKGKTGNVLSRKGERVLVQGINIRKKHVKRKTKVGSAGIIEIEVPLHISNVCLCDEAGQRIKVKLRQAGGSKELYYHDKGKKEVVHRTLRKA